MGAALDIAGLTAAAQSATAAFVTFFQAARRQCIDLFGELSRVMPFDFDNT
ncbi:hypothetical protein XaFJ1_GM001397 [Xanthomonas albilineans]|nr:hypothetical protein XaFJ1_GM001397 [Xanthomonas albilineans]